MDAIASTDAIHHAPTNTAPALELGSWRIDHGVGRPYWLYWVRRVNKVYRLRFTAPRAGKNQVRSDRQDLP
jgi:hypothetical protein